MSEQKPKTNPSGSPEPVEGRCGALLHSNGPDDPRTGRYCLRWKGHGTPHKGVGNCKYHGGSTRNHIVKAERQIVEAEVRTIAEQMGEPATVGDPYVELYRLTGKIKQWEIIATAKMAELQDLTITDRQGVERARAMVEIWERAVDRASSTYINLTKLGLMQHKAQLEADHARLLHKIVTSVIEDHTLALTDAQLATAKRLLNAAIIAAGSRLDLSWLPADMGDPMGEDEDEIFDAVVVA